jgi:Mg-chelatase subunit ChlD
MGVNALDKNISSVVKGSLAQVAKDKGQSIAESFLDADCIVIVDVSGSMEMDDAPGGKTRYDTACSELAALQASLPGKIAVLAFSNDCVFCPNGTPTNMGGSTDLAGALEFAKVVDVPDVRFVIISDGQPDDPEKSLKVARSYRNRIDVIYVGSELSPMGRSFLAQVAKASGGKTVTADRVAQLSTKVQQLLAA